MATIGSIVGGTFGLIRERPAAVAIWGLTYLLGSVAILGIMTLVAGGTMMPGQPVDPQSIGGGFVLTMLFVYFLYILLSIVLINAVYRAILRPHDSAFASLRVGGDEFRMLGLTILFVIGMIVIYFISWLGMMLLGLIVALIARDVPMLGGAMMLLLGLGFMLGWIWFCVRVSLIFPMTFHRRRMAIDEGWSLGKGRFWTLFGSYFLVWVIVAVLAVIVFWSSFAGMADVMRAGNEPGAREAAIERMAAQQAFGTARMIYATVTFSIFSLVSFVLGYGVVGSAARELLAEQGDVTEDDAYRTAEIFE
jgi:hypothetical protein